MGETPVTNHEEDNGPAVTDLSKHYKWFDGLAPALPGQDFYKAVVTIGDEGTENGTPVNAADYSAADVANQAAIDNDVLLFSWVTDDPFAGVPDLFKLMAEGGVNPAFPGNVFEATGGFYLQQGSGDSAALEAKLQEILCVAGGGGVNGVPDGGWSLGLLSASLLGLGVARGRK